MVFLVHLYVVGHALCKLLLRACVCSPLTSSYHMYNPAICCLREYLGAPSGRKIQKVPPPHREPHFHQSATESFTPYHDTHLCISVHSVASYVCSVEFIPRAEPYFIMARQSRCCVGMCALSYTVLHGQSVPPVRT